MTQTREKWDSHVLSRFDFSVDPVYSLFFLFSTRGNKAHLDEDDLRHGFGNVFESAIPKVNHSYFQISILKDTMQLKILYTWIKIGANSFIRT